MSAEEAVTNALNEPVDQNAAAAEDAKNLLAELEAGGADEISKPESNGATNGDKEESVGKPAESTEDKDKADDRDNNESRGKDRDHRRRDRDGDDRRGGGRGGGRGRGRGGKFGRDNIKSVVEVQEKSSDQAAMRKQVEFYFSDSNLPQDQFLMSKVDGHHNNAVELDIICSFKRMRHFEPREAIVEALRTSKTLNLVDDDTKVQRKQPLSKATDDGATEDSVKIYEDKAMPRSVYVKGFGPEIPSTQFDIEAFFAEFGSTNAVRLRRSEDKSFKGSVFAEFETEEEAQKFLQLDPQPKYQDRELQVMSKKEYCEKKVDDIKAGRIKAGKDRWEGRRDRDSHRGGRGGRGGGKFNDRRRDRDEDSRDWRTRRDEDRKNGFRDDKRRDDRDRRGGRERRKSVEKDERGIPVVKTTEVDKVDREKQKAEALAKAKAVVERQEAEKSAANGATEPIKQETTTEELGVKREREDDGTGAEEPAAKKVDIKAEA